MPIVPSAPPDDTAAASRPPATPAIGALISGSVRSNCSVSQATIGAELSLRLFDSRGNIMPVQISA